MANIMNMVNLKNNVHRSGFDLSRRNCFTAKVGEILPVMCEEVLPGDKWRINMREFMRTAPVQTATFGRVRQYYDFYFVPYNLLWDKFESWIMQTKNAFHAKSIAQAVDQFPSHPYISLNEMLKVLTFAKDNAGSIYLDYVYSPDLKELPYKDMVKLFQYLGYPITKSSGLGTDLGLNPFPLLAYQKIYQDYFRYSQWEDAAPWTYNLDYILSVDSLKLDVTTALKNMSKPSMFNLRYCNLDKDYFNGLLPSPQYGDTAIAGPLSGSAVLGSGPYDATFEAGQTDASGSIAMFANNIGAGRFSMGYYSGDSGVTGKRGVVLEKMDFGAKLPVDTSSLGLSILVLRQAEAIQKWKEITLSGDLDYKTQLQKHWNVNISDDNSYMCKYLGGIANNVDISEVINTNLVDSTSEAEIHGKGVSASNGNINFTSHQYGVIMCVYHCKPIIEWSADNILPRMLTKTRATDYAIPEFDQIGMESVLRGQFIYNAAQNWNEPIGYAPRYVDYKTSFDRINGEFQNTLKPWVIPHTIVATSGNPITYKSFKVAPTVLDNMFGVNALEADQFRCTAYFDVKTVRNLDRDGLPY